MRIVRSIFSLAAGLALAVSFGCHGRDDAGDDGGPIGEPIVAPSETWTWVDLPDTLCANGVPTGIGVNLTARSQDLLVFFDGGGACWDYLSCYVLKSAVNLETDYGAAAFQNATVRASPYFERSDAQNPFRDFSFVFVPYCTADVHAGDAVRNYDPLDANRKVHHHGAKNVLALLPRLRGTFPSAPRVYVTGSSAGGYGAQFHFHRFAAAFPGSQVHLLADSSPVVQPVGGRLEAWVDAWNFQMPPGCQGPNPQGTAIVPCTQSFPAAADWLARTYPNSRFGLMEFIDDLTITLFFAYPLDGSFAAAVNGLLTRVYDAHPNSKYFVLSGADHVLLDKSPETAGPGGVTARTWLTGWVTGNSDWESHRP